MADSAKRVLVPTDLLYLLTFAAGMAAFWAGGHASRLLPVMKNHGLALAAGLVVTAGIYGLGLFVISLLATRRLGRGVLIATIVAVALGLAAAQGIVRLAAGHIHTKTDLGLLTFVLYLCYGAIYALSLAIARKFAK
ncbi:MAG TPA: hypothetical protein VMT30_06065 [Candidatus Saccharimonadia bacterium]|nr:hypothetical protein [Candidatus Saccharimonadia bacterium]